MDRIFQVLSYEEKRWAIRLIMILAQCCCLLLVSVCCIAAAAAAAPPLFLTAACWCTELAHSDGHSNWLYLHGFMLGTLNVIPGKWKLKQLTQSDHWNQANFNASALSSKFIVSNFPLC